jgi:hypothetical protein
MRTPGPWRVVGASRTQDGEWDYGIVADIDGRPYLIAEAFGRVAETVRPDAHANAEFIVTACNSYDAMRRVIEAADNLRIYLAQCGDYDCDHSKCELVRAYDRARGGVDGS